MVYPELRSFTLERGEDMKIQEASAGDLEQILIIYNQGIEDRIATVEEQTKDLDYMMGWFRNRSDRYAVLVAKEGDLVLGWASLNPYSHRCAYAGVADLAIYVRREWRGRGIGTQLLELIEQTAKEKGFYKIVLFTLPFNAVGQRLYRKRGFREVGVFRNQGKLDGNFVDVMAMEKIIS